MKAYEAYARGVASGDIISCEYIKLAVRRFNALMNRNDIEFREKEVDYVIDFMSSLKHYTGKHNGKRFIPEPWQQFILATVYGFYVKETGLRLIRSVYIEMARKQGKTAFAAALCLYHLIADGEHGAEVLLAANSKDQAKIGFELCSNFTKGMDPKAKLLEPYRDTVTFSKTASKLKVLAADDSKLDGFNASMYLLDEYHAAKNGKLKDVLQSSQGMRDNPLGVIITTAGFDLLGVCYDYRRMCIEVLNGIKEDSSLAAFIYTIDDGDDWKDEKAWIKSNPNLGVTVYPGFIAGEVRKAINTPSEEVGVKTKSINVWCDSIDVWIPDHYIVESTKRVDLSSFGRETDCYVGVDLSSTSDLSAVSYMVIQDNKFYFKTYYFLPREALKTKKHKELYGEWERLGALIVTSGNVIDYDYILNNLMDKDKEIFIQKIGYDSWNATQFVINAEEKGLPMEPYSQTIGNFNRPTKEMERIILSGNAVVDNNPITRHCFRNVCMARDRNGNIKPSKQFDDKKIDGVVAMIEALGVYLISPHYSNEL